MQREGLTDRVTIHQGRAADAVAVNLPAHDTVCFLAAFVLQEMLEQESTGAVETLLRKTIDRYPHAHWLIIEVDHQPTDRHAMAHALGLAYYNPYFLLHAITEQRLEPAEFWNALFQRAGLDILTLDHPTNNIDSTRLELGYLLHRSQNH